MEFDRSFLVLVAIIAVGTTVVAVCAKPDAEHLITACSNACNKQMKTYDPKTEKCECK